MRWATCRPLAGGCDRPAARRAVGVCRDERCGTSPWQTAARRRSGKRFPTSILPTGKATYRGLLDRARQANPALKIVLCTPFAAPCGKIVEGALGEYYPLRQRILAQCCDRGANRSRLRRDARALFHRLYRRSGNAAAERRCDLLGVGRHPPHACRSATDGRLLDRRRGPERCYGMTKSEPSKARFCLARGQ